jgi:CubicO group peptidase (beta-lactamase class C family)
VTLSTLQAAFDEEAGGPRVAALAAGVTVRGATVFQAAHAVFQATHAVDEATLFRVASVTKTFTALAVMQLVEQRRIGLDDPVNSRLRALRVQPPKAAPAVTVRHLLTHQAGLREPLRWSDLLRPSRFIGPRVGQRVPRLADLYRTGITARVTPGTAWSYSNDGYAILGQLVEDVTGTPYPGYVADEIWRALGMSDSTFAPDQNASVAPGHRLRRGQLRPVPQRIVVKTAAGGAYSSLADMLRYAAALAEPSGGELVTAATLEEMYRPHVLLADRVPYTGLGVFLDRIDGHRIVYHPGDFPGYEAALFVAPDDGVGAVVLCNSTARGAALRLARQLVTRALGVDTDIDTDRGIEGRAADWLPAGVVDRVVGDYAAEPGWRQNLRVAAMTGGRLTVAARDGGLVIKSRFGALRAPRELVSVAGSDDMHFRLQLRGAPYDRVPLDAVFLPGPDGRAERVDLGMLGARFHRR